MSTVTLTPKPRGWFVSPTTHKANLKHNFFCFVLPLGKSGRSRAFRREAEIWTLCTYKHVLSTNCTLYQLPWTKRILIVTCKVLLLCRDISPHWLCMAGSSWQSTRGWGRTGSWKFLSMRLASHPRVHMMIKISGGHWRRVRVEQRLSADPLQGQQWICLGTLYGARHSKRSTSTRQMQHFLKYQVFRQN